MEQHQREMQEQARLQEERLKNEREIEQILYEERKRDEEARMAKPIDSLTDRRARITFKKEFNGNRMEDVRKWLTRVEEATPSPLWSDNARIDYAKSLMGDAVYDWFKKRELEDDDMDWKQVRNLMIRRWDKSKTNAFLELRKAKQGDNEFTDNFIARLERLMIQADVEDDQAKVQLLLNGLKERYSAPALRRLDVVTYDDLCRQVIREEEVQRLERREIGRDHDRSRRYNRPESRDKYKNSYNDQYNRDYNQDRYEDRIYNRNSERDNESERPHYNEYNDRDRQRYNDQRIQDRDSNQDRQYRDTQQPRMDGNHRSGNDRTNNSNTTTRRVNTIAAHHQLLVVDVKINNSIQRAMVDSGSSHNVISMTKARELSLLLKESPSSMIVANGNNEPTKWITEEVILSIMGKRYKTQFIVMDNLSNEIILGIPFLTTMSPIIDWKTKTLSWREVNTC